VEWRAIVIGGLAVEFWTHGAYATTDIDLYDLRRRVDRGETIETWELHESACSASHNSGMRTKRFTDWLVEHARARKRVERIERAFAEPYRRERPRDREKARLLRERGTPEHLIGPEK